MRLTTFLFFPLSFYLVLYAATATSFLSKKPAQEMPSDTQVQLQEIDDQIRELEEMKRGFEAKAMRHEDQAIRLQFNERWNLEVRRHLELAEENRKMAETCQKEIDRLKKQRAILLRQNGADDGFEDL